MKKTADDKSDVLLKDLLKSSKRIYGRRLITLAIFGSWASGRNAPDSDIDILIVAQDLPRKRLDRVREFSPVEKALENETHRLRQKGINTYFSPIFKTPDEVKRGSLLFLDMLLDIHILFDRGRFFSSFLKDFKKRLDKLGAKRIEREGKWFWVLKPDYKPGETFEI